MPNVHYLLFTVGLYHPTAHGRTGPPRVLLSNPEPIDTPIGVQLASATVDGVTYVAYANRVAGLTDAQLAEAKRLAWVRLSRWVEALNTE